MIGEKFSKEYVKKEKRELSKECLQRLETIEKAIESDKSLSNLKTMLYLDNDYIKEVNIENKELKVGDILRIYRRDGHGVPEEEVVTNIDIINENTAKIYTLNGYIIFKNGTHRGNFIWNEYSSVSDYIKEYITLVNLNTVYINKDN